MSDVNVFRKSRNAPETLPARIEIRDVAGDARPKASPAGAYGEVRGGDRGNTGRAPWPLPKSSILEVRWTHPFESFDIQGLLSSGARIYVEGKIRWVLLDLEDGKSKVGGLRGLGEAVLDGENQHLLQPDPNGQLQALAYDRGQPVYWSSLYFNADIDRTFAAPVGDALFLVGAEKPQPGNENTFKPTWTILESLPAFPIPEIRQSRQLQPGSVEPLLFESTSYKVAAWSQGAVLAFARRLFFVDADLQVTAVLGGSFEPVALSVDESGVAYLLVDEPGNRRALWVVNAAGERTLRYLLPAPFEKTSLPPLLGFNRDVILRGPKNLLCLTESGAIRWSRPFSQAGGVLISGDGRLLACDGKQLVIFDDEGQRTVLHNFDEPLVGTPMLLEGGVILCACAHAVYSLRPHPRAKAAI